MIMQNSDEDAGRIESGLKTAFMISPVREVTDKEKEVIDNYVAKLESQSYRVYYPLRDTDQNDPVGLRICTDNREAIAKADEVHTYWNRDNKGSLFDLGMAFMANYFIPDKKIILANKEMVELMRTTHKSFENVLLELDKIFRRR